MDTQELPVYDDVDFKPVVRGERMLRSEAARTRRKALKAVRESRVLNQWAKARRAKKKKS